jgi:predicted MPP superfamily phosphohydrolase
MSTKRIVAVADFHSGHRAGLTPPAWELRSERGKRQKFARIRTECWTVYAKWAKEHARPDLLVVNGDAIDGDNDRSGGTELIVRDRDEQVEMAEECIKLWKPKRVCIIRGTAYHGGEDEDWEDVLAQRFGGGAHDHEWFDVNGVVLDFKHHVGGSQVPHTRLTAISREQVWNELWHEAEYAPRADFLLRAHVHYSTGGFFWRGRRQVWAITLPALQGMGSKYGARRMTGLVDFGFAWFNVDAKGTVDWEVQCAHIKSQRTVATKV